jgi:hypothetical protein
MEGKAETLCGLCGESMAPGEQMFKYHGLLGPCPKPPLPKVHTGVELIAQERLRQISVEGWTPEHDDKHDDFELSAAGQCYVVAAVQLDPANVHPPFSWPWEKSWWKPSPDPIRNLVKAGALIAAEIDRIQRLGNK